MENSKKQSNDKKKCCWFLACSN